MEKKITRKDIAKLAGVSVSVVSRTLNNSGYVAADKRKKILALANELHYVPHPVAMSLQQARTKQILFYCKDLHNSFNIDLYSGMIEGALQYGYMVLINGALKFDDIRNVMIDGIIFQNEHLASYYSSKYGKNYFIPVVTASFGGLLDASKSIPVIEWDLADSMNKAIAYLKKRGHRRIAYTSPYPFTDNNGRNNAWKDIMKDIFRESLQNYYLDITPYLKETCSSNDWNSNTILEHEETFYDKGVDAADVFLSRHLNATAIVCFNDEMAIGLIQRLGEKGCRVPEDISVISFDASHRGKNFTPVITSIAPDNRKFGSDLATLLIRYIRGEKISYFTKQPVRIREGSSVKSI